MNQDDSATDWSASDISDLANAYRRYATHGTEVRAWDDLGPGERDHYRNVVLAMGTDRFRKLVPAMIAHERAVAQSAPRQEGIAGTCRYCHGPVHWDDGHTVSGRDGTWHNRCAFQEELRGLVERQRDAAQATAERLREAIRWALGEVGTFCERKPEDGAFYWRAELRARAALAASVSDGPRPAAAAPPTSEGNTP
jgi:hypothetical protein